MHRNHERKLKTVGTGSRRAFLVNCCGLAAATVVRPPMLCLAAQPKLTDIRVEDLSVEYEDYAFRTPIKFGGMVQDKSTILNVRCVVRTPAGKSARGFGSMPLNNIWSFPSRTMPYETTLGAMKALVERIQKITSACKEYAHPIDLNVLLEPEYLKAASELSGRLKLDAPIPKLCTLVTASAFDAALHDAFGKLHGLSCYRTYGPQFMRHDLSHYLTPEFKGEYLDRYVLAVPKPTMPVYHLVGALDPVAPADVKERVGDGLPEHLAEWIHYNGLTHIKIKLNGDDLNWDVERVLRVDAVAADTQRKRGVPRWYYSLDFNERCPNVKYLLDFVRRVKERSPGAYGRIQYIEQPTARDLKAHREDDVHAAAKLLPIVIDESLTDLETLQLAREMGYTGVALKACKCQSQAVLMGAAAQKYKMFLCVQDLACPGASLIHSAGLAAYVPGVAGIEHNSRQYMPAANKSWEAKFPAIFRIKDGTMRTAVLTRPGLSAV